MKQSISPWVFVAVIVIVLVVAAVSGWAVWKAPTGSAGPPVSRAEVNKAMKESHSGPTQSELQQIQEWKKSHPGAYSKY